MTREYKSAYRMRNKKKCRCGNPKKEHQKICNPCHAAYMREWRKWHKLNPEQKKKDNARSMAKVYYQRGKIEKRPCYFCKTKKNLERHHTDYNFPLKIIWLCKKCHRKNNNYTFPKKAYANNN